MLTDHDPFIVVDIDGALQSDGKWSDLSHDLCRSLPGAVVELSQSGRGLHLWLKAKATPEHANKRTDLHIECYSAGRYVLLGSQATGAMVDDCPGIHDVVARYFPPRAAAVAVVGDGDGDFWAW